MTFSLISSIHCSCHISFYNWHVSFRFKTACLVTFSISSGFTTFCIWFQGVSRHILLLHCFVHSNDILEFLTIGFFYYCFSMSNWFVDSIDQWCCNQSGVRGHHCHTLRLGSPNFISTIAYFHRKVLIYLCLPSFHDPLHKHRLALIDTTPSRLAFKEQESCLPQFKLQPPE